MFVLGIETSCDETAVAVVKDGREVLSNVVFSQVQEHAPFKGVVPEIASRNHLRKIVPVCDEALRKAGISLAQVDGIAVTMGPGLIGSLLVGVQFAKALSFALSKPIVGVHHLEAHWFAIFLTPAPPSFPFVALVASGGHTHLFEVRAVGDATLLGQTLDDAAGEAFDKAASLLSLPYPGGVHIQKTAQGHNPNAIRFPRGMSKSDSLNFSFSGMKTALKRYLQEHGETAQEKLGEIAASFQEAIVDCLVEKAISAAKGTKKLVLAGGVAANQRLRERLALACKNAGIGFFPVPLEFCTDNGAMVAGLGYHYLCCEMRPSKWCKYGLDIDAMDGWVV
jgi:N6-L-threonylcarbamoyladenine synthase